MMFEDYPLAKAYGWKAPKRDTGGILFLYPPRQSKMHRHNRSDKEIRFVYMKHQRPHALNPDDLHEIQFRDNGDPHTNQNKRRRK